MKHYYITDPNAEKGFVEVTEDEFTSFVGTEEARPYASKVYRGAISIEDVPEDIRVQVQTVVDNRIARFGEYNKQEIPAEELKSMIEGVV